MPPDIVKIPAMATVYPTKFSPRPMLASVEAVRSVVPS
jgi:hypothetical protein